MRLQSHFVERLLSFCARVFVRPTTASSLSSRRRRRRGRNGGVKETVNPRVRGKNYKKTLILSVAFACASLWLASSISRRAGGRRKVLRYPITRLYKTALPCVAGDGVIDGRATEQSKRLLGEKPRRDPSSGALTATAVTLIRTPMNECETVKIVSWLENLRATWPWLEKYDHVVLHEDDYSTRCPQDLEQRFNTLRENNRRGRVKCLSVSKIPGAYRFPDATEENGFALNFNYPVDARNVGYMHMCRLFSILIFPHLEKEMGYDYVLRMDNDNVPLKETQDLFEYVHERDAVYGYPAELPEWHAETPPTLGLWLQDKIFAKNDGDFGGERNETYLNHVSSLYFRNQTALHELAENIFFTNFFVTRLRFWSQPHMVRFLNEIDASGNIYTHRWGDAPIHHVVLGLFADSCSVLDLCDVAYKHGSTGHVIDACELKRVEVHRWNEAINPECRGNRMLRRKRKREKVNASLGTHPTTWFERRDVSRCDVPTSEGKFVDKTSPKPWWYYSTWKHDGTLVDESRKSSFMPRQGEDCYYHVFSRAETRECARAKWFVFAGGQNAFAAYASLMSTLSPGFVSRQEFSIQFGRAYDVFIDVDSGRVVHYNTTALGFEEGRLNRVRAVGQTRGNPSGTTPFTEAQKARYAEFLFSSSMPSSSDGNPHRLTRVTVFVCHYWTNVKDALWLATHPPSFSDSRALQFWAQVPSYEIQSLCVEDVDYCWGTRDPGRHAVRRQRRQTASELREFLDVAKMQCQTRSARCFVLGALPPEKRFQRMLKDIWKTSGVTDESVYLIEPTRVFASRMSELLSRGYVMSSFATHWLLQMALNTGCEVASQRSATDARLFTFDVTCSGLPLLDDDENLCASHVVKHRKKRWWLYPFNSRHTKTSNKESRCKIVRERCLLSEVID